MSEDLPGGWIATRLDALAEVRLGRQRSPDRATGPNMTPYMRAANVTWGGIKVDDVKEMDFSPAEVAVYGLKRGDVLIGEASGSRNEVGKSGVWNDEIPGACFQNTLIRARPLGSSTLDSHYLQLHLQQDALSGALADASRGIGIHHLGREALAAWKIRLPPLNEQRRIVAKLEDLLARSRRAKDALDAIPPLLEKLRQSILASAFLGDLTADWRAKHPDVESAHELLKRIRVERRKKWEEAELSKMRTKGKVPVDDRWKAKYQEPEAVDTSGLPELPEGWCWANLEELSFLITSGSRGWAEYYASEGALFIRSQDINTDALRLIDVAHVLVPAGGEGTRTRVETDDLLITITGANVTRAAWVCQEIAEAYVSQHVALVKLVRSALAATLHLWLIAEDGGRLQLKAKAYGLGKPGLNLEDLARVHVPLPPLLEQRQLVRIVASALDRVAQAGATTDKLSDTLPWLDRSTLQKAFRGELVEQDPNDEPASVMLERLASERAASESAKPCAPAKREKRAR